MSIQYVNDGSEWSGEIAPVLSTDLVDSAFCISNQDFYDEFERVDSLEEIFDETGKVESDESFYNIHKMAQRRVFSEKGIEAFGVNNLFQDEERDIFYLNEIGQMVLLDVYGGNVHSILDISPEFAHFTYGPWQFVGNLEDYEY